MKTLLLLLLLFSGGKINATCELVGDEKNETKIEISNLVCEELTNREWTLSIRKLNISVPHKIVIQSIKRDWARVLVDGSEIFYLFADKEKERRINGVLIKWNIIASGKEFNIKDWKRLGIPKEIR